MLPFALTLSLVSGATGVYIKKTGRYLDCIYFGLFVMTLGIGLFINLDAHSSWAKIVLYQMVAGLGTGPLFQAPLLALQSMVAPGDIATATATFGFTRNLATSISVVVGGVIFQNGMKTQLPKLVRELGPKAGQALGGGSAGANVMLVNTLPPAQREVARQAFRDGVAEDLDFVCQRGRGGTVDERADSEDDAGEAAHGDEDGVGGGRTEGEGESASEGGEG